MSRSASDAQRAALERLLELAGEKEAREILADLSGTAMQIEFERAVVRRLAYRLLQARAPRPQIRDRLVARGISERTAYRVIDDILDLGPRTSATQGPLMADGTGMLAAPNNEGLHP